MREKGFPVFKKISTIGNEEVRVIEMVTSPLRLLQMSEN